eukprot:CAMPEP_0173449286 /NCGR_PEP_ID=MMETSP1357-20121228/42470_1 /TAXON_ID=77926 /ORGANISM="Hemiselmis rufescens, Strain PCC563" /LENGTH=42 /DNA_ID= /DNA_START= /DNA_END= /DNA_ORIENTATION=
MASQCGVGLLLEASERQTGPGRRVTGVKQGSPAEQSGKVRAG